MPSTLLRIRRALATIWTGPNDLPRPLKLERRLVLGRWLGIAVFVLALGLHSLSERQAFIAYCILVVAFAYSLVLWEALKRKHRGWVVGVLPTLGDGLLCAAMIPLLGGFDSPFYAVLYAVVVATGMRLGFARGMLLAGAIAALDLALRMAQGGGFDAGFTVRSGVLFMTVLLTSFLYEESQKSEAELASRLHQSQELNGALEHQALHDLLTGLPNRTLLHEHVQQAIIGPRRDNSSVALLVIDLDRFKEVNDTFGHQYGDLLLQKIGPRLSDALGPCDTIARLGGDEFAVLLPEADAAHAERVARDILVALERSFSVSE